MWGCHGDPISSYTHPSCLTPSTPHLLLPLLLLPGCKQDRGKMKRGKNTLVAQTMIVDERRGGEEERKREERRGEEVWCWWLGEQLVSRLVVLEFGGWGFRGHILLCCLGWLFVCEFVASVISVPSMGSEWQLTAECKGGDTVTLSLVIHCAWLSPWVPHMIEFMHMSRCSKSTQPLTYSTSYECFQDLDKKKMLYVFLQLDWTIKADCCQIIWHMSSTSGTGYVWLIIACIFVIPLSFI